jgi:hypothetical protein
VNRDVQLVLGLGLAALVGAVVVSQLEGRAIASEIAKARDALFEVDPGCTTIRFRGGADAMDPAAAEAARRYYFEPFVREELAAGASADAEALGVPVETLLTERALYRLFPECAARDPKPWPPESLLVGGPFSMVWIAMHLYIGGIAGDVLGEAGGA